MMNNLITLLKWYLRTTIIILFWIEMRIVLFATKPWSIVITLRSVLIQQNTTKCFMIELLRSWSICLILTWMLHFAKQWEEKKLLLIKIAKYNRISLLEKIIRCLTMLAKWIWTVDFGRRLISIRVLQNLSYLS